MNQGEDLCLEVTLTVSVGVSAWGRGGLRASGSLLLLTPAAWIATRGAEAVCSPSSRPFLVRVPIGVHAWGRGGGPEDSAGGSSKLGTSFGLLTSAIHTRGGGERTTVWPQYGHETGRTRGREEAGRGTHEVHTTRRMEIKKQSAKSMNKGAH